MISTTVAGNSSRTKGLRILWHVLFPRGTEAKTLPYDIHDMAQNEACVSIRRDHDTPGLAVVSLRRWWNEMGKRRYPEAGIRDRLTRPSTKILRKINRVYSLIRNCVRAVAGVLFRELQGFANVGLRFVGLNRTPMPRRASYSSPPKGGRDGYRSRAWKHGMQKLPDETRLCIHASQPSPGMSKFNNLKHRLFCQITPNWQGKPLRTFEMIFHMVGKTRTAAGFGSRPSTTRESTGPATSPRTRKWTPCRFIEAISTATGTGRMWAICRAILPA